MPGGIIVIAAHPDDEAIGLATRLAALELAAIVHITDGAPRTGDDIRNAGCSTWQQYAALRRREFHRALEVTGASGPWNSCLDYPDQQASFHISEIALALIGIFQRIRPAAVFTHPYEGGHPDHDATAAAVHAAHRFLGNDFSLFEFASYHAGPSGLETESFLENSDGPVINRILSPEQREHKRKIFDCYTSQRRVLEQFPLRSEPIRPAPEYDFHQAPHAGTLWYERFNWGIDGTKWRAVAAQAFRQLATHVPAA